MKYKHGFIGNSSSASYYIRRGANKTIDASLEIQSGEGTDTAIYTSSGVVYDSWYAWNNKRTGKMSAKSVIPFSNADISSGTGVKEVKFYAYGLVRDDRDARLVTDATEYVSDYFNDTGVVFKVYSEYFVDTETDPAYNLTKGVAWADAATVSNGALEVTANGDGSGEQDGFNVSVNWDGVTLTISANFEQETTKNLTSCAIGIKKLVVTQDELF